MTASAILTTYEDILQSACTYTGRVRSELTSEEEVMFRSFIQNRLRHIWTLRDWPFIYKITSLPVIGSKVYWYDDFTDIPDITNIYTVDPVPGVKAPTIDYQIRTGGEVYVNSDATTVYVEHRLRPPKIASATVYSDTVTYLRNDKVIFTDGNIYSQNYPVTTTVYPGIPYTIYLPTTGKAPDEANDNAWNLVELYDPFAVYAAMRAGADMLQADNQMDQFRQLYADSKDELDLQIGRVTQQNQLTRTRVLTR
jgi:hypothetical protein